MMFEENAREITDKMRSLGFDIDTLAAQNKILPDHVHIERSGIEETGESDLEALFAGLPNHAILRVELRRLVRWLKDRGAAHSTNEYPFIIGERGRSVLPITSIQPDHPASAERISTGIARLDAMLGGKSSIGAKFADTACRRCERPLIFAC